MILNYEENGVNMRVVYEGYTNRDAVLYFLKEVSPNVFVTTSKPTYAHLYNVVHEKSLNATCWKEKFLKANENLFVLNLCKNFLLKFDNGLVPDTEFTSNEEKKKWGKHQVITAEAKTTPIVKAIKK